jgi:hypothetical protein
VPDPALRELLDRRDTLVELRQGEGPAVVLGVPHHAAPGVDRIAERRSEGGRVSDENAVVYALLCFEALRERDLPVRLVVAAHATDHDPNKIVSSPYCSAVLDGVAPRLLLECHGAGLRAPHDLELTAGSNDRAEPLRFGRLLARALGPGFPVAVQTIPGERSGVLMDGADGVGAEATLRYPALRTRSLAEASLRDVPALHVEAKPRFRLCDDGGMSPTEAGRRLGRGLAEALGGYLE